MFVHADGYALGVLSEGSEACPNKLLNALPADAGQWRERFREQEAVLRVGPLIWEFHQSGQLTASFREVLHFNTCSTA
jgi:hypothetical protein